MDIIFCVYLLTTLLPLAFGLWRFRQMDKASRLFCYIAGVSFLGELAGLASAILIHSNRLVYSLVGIINLVLLCLYFNNSIDIFRKYRTGIILALLTFLVWLISLVFFDGLEKDEDPVYMFYEAILTMVMSITAIEQLLVKKSRSWIRLRNSPHFWFAWILFTYWSIAICHWLLRSHFKPLTESHGWFNDLLLVVTMLVNVAFAIIFFRYPKMQSQDAS